MRPLKAFKILAVQAVLFLLLWLVCWAIEPLLGMEAHVAAVFIFCAALFLGPLNTRREKQHE